MARFNIAELVRKKQKGETEREQPAEMEGGGSRNAESHKFLQKAINPEHKGYCTPMTKSTCTPRRKALAKRLKPGGDLYKGG